MSDESKFLLGSLAFLIAIVAVLVVSNVGFKP